MNNELIKDLEHLCTDFRRVEAANVQNQIFLENLTIRLALAQLRTGPLEYRSHKHYWDKVVGLVEKKKLSLCHDGCVLLESAELTEAGLLKSAELTEAGLLAAIAAEEHARYVSLVESRPAL